MRAVAEGVKIFVPCHSMGNEVMRGENEGVKVVIPFFFGTCRDEIGV